MDVNELKQFEIFNKLNDEEVSLFKEKMREITVPEGENFILLGNYGSKEGAKQFIYKNKLDEFEYKIIINEIDDYEFYRATIGPLRTIRESIAVLKRIRENLPEAAFIKLVKAE